MPHPRQMNKPLDQKYESAYYCWQRGCDVEHYVMFDGIRTRQSSKDDALRICEGINARHGLPDVNVDKSSQYHLKKGP